MRKTCGGLGLPVRQDACAGLAAQRLSTICVPLPPQICLSHIKPLPCLCVLKYACVQARAASVAPRPATETDGRRKTRNLAFEEGRQLRRHRWLFVLAYRQLWLSHTQPDRTRVQARAASPLQFPGP